MKRYMAIVIAVLTALVFVGCQKPVTNNTDVDPTHVPGTVKVSYLNESGAHAPIKIYTSNEALLTGTAYNSLFTNVNLAFAQNMASAMPEGWTGVFSPLSLQIALEVLSNGGDEDTARKLLNAVCPGMTRADVDASAAYLIAAIMKSNGVNISTAVVVNNADRLCQEFANKAADYYRAAVGALDFSKPEEALNEINEWMKKNTNGLIERILDELRPDDAAVILNALSLELKWASPFYAIRELGEFKGHNGVEYVSLIQSAGDYSYGKFDDGEVAVLPYDGGEYAMAVILPSEGSDPVQAMNSLLGRLGELKTTNVLVKMPKLDIKTDLDIMQYAGAMNLAEGLGGIYPNLIENGSTCVSKVVQSSVLKVTEDGTVAASGTAVVATKGEMIIKGDVEFTVDRPYVTVIYHVETGAVLFVSIINDII